MTIEIRATQPEQYRAASDTVMAALLHAPLGDDEWAERASTWSGTPSISAWDEGRCVAHACQFLVETTVPGGARLPTGAVSRVGVLPSHRRRGVATDLMTALVGDAVDRGLSLMSLRATEAVIYQRYGFGLAGEFASINVSSRRATPVAGATTAGSFRILGPDEILDVVVPLYDRFAHRRPGVITRTDMFWTRYFGSAIDRSKASYIAIHFDDAGEADGYAHYDLDWDEDHRDGPTGVGEVNEVIGVDDAVELALWQYLFHIDLVTSWKADERPVDDLVRMAVHDPRAYRVRSIDDEQWLRLVDVDRCLRSRTYGAAARSVVIAVSDPLIETNNGSWRIAPEGVASTDDAADIDVGIRTLSAAYLGGPSWTALAATHPVDCTDPSALQVADMLFASRPLPFCGSFF